MSLRCPKCGNFVEHDERFCTKCGENLQNVVWDQFSGNVDPNMNQYHTQYNSYDNRMPVDNSDMSFKQWVATVLVTTLFGIVSLVFLFIWGFGSGPEARKKYCKAMLIVKAISVGISIVLMIVYMGIINSLIVDLSRKYYEDYGYYYGDEYDEYGQDAELTIDV